MSRYYNDFIEHSWGDSPKQKAREKEYNAWYYRTHKKKTLNGNIIEDATDKFDDWVGITDRDRYLRNKKKYEDRKKDYDKFRKWDEEAGIDPDSEDAYSNEYKEIYLKNAEDRLKLSEEYYMNTPIGKLHKAKKKVGQLLIDVGNKIVY